MTKEEKYARSLGFISSASAGFKMFKKIPIYPEIITPNELQKQMKMTSTEYKHVFSRIPAEAPVFADFGEIGRWK